MKKFFELAAFIFLVISMTSEAIAGGSYTLVVGQSQTLTFSPREGGRDFVWASDDPESVEVTSQNATTAVVLARRGAARPVTVGCSYVVTVYGSGFSYDDRVREEFYISVPPDVESINIPSSLELVKGDSYAFSPSILPEGAVTELTWSSSNPDVALVNQRGELTAVGEGTAQICVSAASGHTASCNLTVVLPTVCLNCDVNRHVILAGTAVTLSAEPSDATIYYTLDGSMPEASSSTRYSAPILIERDLTLKAVACKDDYYDSPVLTRDYRISTLAVESTDPGDGSRLIRPDAVPAILFNTAICPSSAYAGIALTDAAGHNISGGTVISGRRLFFISDAPLPRGVYRLTLPAYAVASYDGDPLILPYECSFELMDASPDVVSVHAGATTMFLKADASLWGWGDNSAAQLACGTTEKVDSPIRIMDAVHSYAECMAVDSDGALWSWGVNKKGNVGDGTLAPRYSPVKIMEGVRSVSNNGYVRMALKHDGSLWAWGENYRGQLGAGGESDRYSPCKILDDVETFWQGFDNCFALKTDASLWAWGYNPQGTLGDGSTTNRLSPVYVMSGVKSVSIGYNFVLAVKTDGSLWAWGHNGSGQLGIGSTVERKVSPVKVMDDVKMAVAAHTTSYALKVDGSLWAWGANFNSQIGDGTDTDRRQPVRIIASDVRGVKAFNSSWTTGYAMALTADDVLLAWGCGGKLGDGTSEGRNTPVRILDGVADVSLGECNAALRTDGSLWAWGNNLPDGLSGSKKPVPVVDDGVVEPASLSLDDALVVATGARSVAVALTEPAAASYRSIDWFSSDPEVLAVDARGVLCGLSDGEAVLTAEITACDGRRLSAESRVRVFDKAAVSGLEAESILKVASDGLTLHVNVPAVVYSLAGVELFRSDDAPLLWTAPAPGLYILQTESGVHRRVLLR